MSDAVPSCPIPSIAPPRRQRRGRPSLPHPTFSNTPASYRGPLFSLVTVPSSLSSRSPLLSHRGPLFSPPRFPHLRAPGPPARHTAPHVQFVGWPSKPANFDTNKQLGIIYCMNRPSRLYALRMSEPDAQPQCITEGLLSAHTPRFTPDGSVIIFLSNEAAATTGVHNGTGETAVGKGTSGPSSLAPARGPATLACLSPSVVRRPPSASADGEHLRLCHSCLGALGGDMDARGLTDRSIDRSFVPMCCLACWIVAEVEGAL